MTVVAQIDTQCLAWDPAFGTVMNTIGNLAGAVKVQRLKESLTTTREHAIMAKLMI